MSCFKIKDIGRLNYILGIRVRWNHIEGNVYLDQEGLITRTVERYLGRNCYPSSIPWSHSTKLEAYEGNSSDFDRKRYQAIVGSLLYVSRYTRPDITAIVGVTTRFCSNPGRNHIDAAERVLRYLYGTKDQVLTLNSKGTLGINVYCDADWGGDSSERKSTSGYAVFIGKALVAWSSKVQQCISLSTTEAEYVALTEAVKESLWLKQLLSELGIHDTVPIIKCDNQAAISLSKYNTNHKRSKHIEIRYHFIRNLSERREIQVEYIKSNQNTADIFTKSIAKDQFGIHKQALGILYPPTSGSVEN